jgi:hypothetical protein
MKRGLFGVLVPAVAVFAMACANGGPVAGDYGTGDQGGPGSARGQGDDGGGSSGDASFGNNGNNGNQGTGGGDASQSNGNQGGDDAGNPPPPDDAGSKDSGKQQPPPQDAGNNNNSTCADPNTPASCHACSGNNCQPNGCYGGYVCYTVTNKCKAPNSCP